MFFVSGTTPKPTATKDPLNSTGQVAVFKIFFRSQEMSKVYRNFVPSCDFRLFHSSRNIGPQSVHVSAVVLREIEKILTFLHSGHAENWH